MALFCLSYRFFSFKIPKSLHYLDTHHYFSSGWASSGFWSVCRTGSEPEAGPSSSRTGGVQEPGSVPRAGWEPLPVALVSGSLPLVQLAGTLALSCHSASASCLLSVSLSPSLHHLTRLRDTVNTESLYMSWSVWWTIVYLHSQKLLLLQCHSGLHHPFHGWNLNGQKNRKAEGKTRKVRSIHPSIYAYGSIYLRSCQTFHALLLLLTKQNVKLK